MHPAIPEASRKRGAHHHHRPHLYWPGASEVDVVGVEAFPDTRWGAQFGTFSGLFGPVFNEIHTLTSVPIFIVETSLAPLDGSGYQPLSGLASDAYSRSGDGILQLQKTQTLTGTQWNELDRAMADDRSTGTDTTEGR